MKINIKLDDITELCKSQVHPSLGQYELSTAIKADIILLFRVSFDYGLEKIRRTVIKYTFLIESQLGV